MSKTPLTIPRKIISKRQNGSIRVVTPVGEKSMTDQSFKDECDVNNIISKFKKTGNLTHVARIQGTYGDFSDIPDLQQAMQTVTDAQANFEALPSNIRSRFGNSPVEFLNFLSDPSNDQEAIKLGLKIPKAGPDLPDTAGNKPEGRVSPKPSTKRTPVEDKQTNED